MEPETDTTRLDLHVVKALPELSRSTAAKLIEQGKVMVNGQPRYKPSHRLNAGDKVEVDYSQPQIESIDLPVIYEDDECVVVNKPTGLLTHSKGTFNPEPTVASWLATRLNGLLAGDRAGIVHRLDRGTSGVMICAKTPAAQSWLQKQFSQRKVKKNYLALVEGELAEPEAVIDMPIERHPKKPQTFRAGQGGKSAVTHYEVLSFAPQANLSLVRLSPVTGRTHQLRVHMSQLKHPILGDVLYGGASAPRLMLHAVQLELTLPNRQRKVFKAPAPPEFDAKGKL